MLETDYCPYCNAEIETDEVDREIEGAELRIEHNKEIENED